MDQNQPSHGVPAMLIAVRILLQDLCWLAGIQSCILAAIAIVGGCDQGDVLFAAALLVFLAPGWLVAPSLLPKSAGVTSRYAMATIASFVLHVWIAWPASRLELSFDAYYVVFATVTGITISLRLRGLLRHPPGRYKIRLDQAILGVAFLVFIAGAYRVPHSNDIGQFLMQQIDMAQTRSLAPSPIGMTAFGLSEPMPRWDANAYHVWFSLMADATRVPVEGLVRRWATVPIAAIAFLMLSVCVSTYSFGRARLWMIALAIVGPATIWFRTYSAYVYGMRLTNNLCLDKDFAMFWLIPAWLWVLHRGLRSGHRPSWYVLLAMTPLCVLIHPMTSVYLFVLTPVAIVTAMPRNRMGIKRAVLGGAFALGMFAFVFTSGGAQAFHQEIEAIIAHDVAWCSRTGGKLHHWIGHYNAVPELALEMDTTRWNNDALQLNPRLLWTGSGLITLQFGCLAWLATLVIWKRQRLASQVQRWLGIVLAVVGLWSLFVVSGILLGSRPHLYRGIERLHWFAFLPAMIAMTGFLSLAVANVCRGMSRANRRRLLLAATALVSIHVAEQGWSVGNGKPTLMSRLPILHSVYDFYAPDQPAKDERVLSRFHLSDGPVTPRPDYLNDGDRILILRCVDRAAYWELRQSVWWPELYGEANVLAERGKPFLSRWQAYYDAMDWSSSPSTDEWIRNQQVNLIVDEREGANEYVSDLASRLGVQVQQVATDTWRLEID